MLKSTLTLLLLFSLGWSKVVVYEGKGEECDTLLYAETFNLILGEEHQIDLTDLDATAICSTGPTLEISFDKAADNVTNLKVSIGFSATDTGYWSSDAMNVSYSDGTDDINLTGKFNSASAHKISKSFSFACSLPSVTSLNTSPAGKKAVVNMNMYQIQAFNVADSKFLDSYQCVNWISKGAWMGIFCGVVMIVVLTLSIMVLFSTVTPDRFETSKSKCLIIPHEH